MTDQITPPMDPAMVKPWLAALVKASASMVRGATETAAQMHRANGMRFPARTKAHEEITIIFAALVEMLDDEDEIEIARQLGALAVAIMPDERLDILESLHDFTAHAAAAAQDDARSADQYRREEEIARRNDE